PYYRKARPVSLVQVKNGADLAVLSENPDFAAFTYCIIFRRFTSLVPSYKAGPIEPHETEDAMRERLDCAVLLTRCTLSWTQPILGQHAGGRLHLHGYDVLVDIDQEGAHAVLGQASMALRRYDACLLPVSPATLSWARTSLSHAGRSLHTPVMALVRDLTATGLHDLYGLGVADFLRSPFCGHEARVRVERLLDAKRAEMLAPAQLGDAAAEAAQYAASLHGHPDDCRADMPELEAFAVAAASHCEAMRDTFRDAKSKVVERFERAYITAALGRHE